MSVLPENDVRLIERLLARETEAWQEFVLRFQGLVCARIRYAAQGCRTRLTDVDVDDLAADVFTSIVANDLSALRQFQGRCSLATWIGLIARRKCVRYLTSSKAAAASPLQFDPAEEIVIEEDPLQRLVDSENAAEIRDSLELLQEGDRQVLSMYYLQELGYQQISERLGVSINTVGPKIHRAQSRLRKLMRWK